jgi:hypothetical protein
LAISYWLLVAKNIYLFSSINYTPSKFGRLLNWDYWLVGFGPPSDESQAGCLTFWVFGHRLTARARNMGGQTRVKKEF